MKLDVNLDALLNAVKKMGVSKLVDISLGENLDPIKPDMDTTLSTSTGIEIDINDVEIEFGVFTYKGRQVLLFIPDHSYANIFYETLNDPFKGNRFHLTDCSTLENMRHKGRFARYYVTTNRNGLFKIYNSHGNEAEVQLKVCRNCLSKLNYKNYSYNRTQVFEQFNLGEFFEHYAHYFRNLPENRNQDKAGYADNWVEISAQRKKEQHYCCESCGVNLSNHTHLLDTHHKNGVKRDNRKENLQVLCKLCHSEQDAHDHYIVSELDRMLIEYLRQK